MGGILQLELYGGMTFSELVNSLQHDTQSCHTCGAHKVFHTHSRSTHRVFANCRPHLFKTSRKVALTTTVHYDSSQNRRLHKLDVFIALRTNYSCTHKAELWKQNSSLTRTSKSEMGRGKKEMVCLRSF